jgi:hypothetical protein
MPTIQTVLIINKSYQLQTFHEGNICLDFLNPLGLYGRTKFIHMLTVMPTLLIMSQKNQVQIIYRIS